MVWLSWIRKNGNKVWWALTREHKTDPVWLLMCVLLIVMFVALLAILAGLL